jgi:hypothetical protein
MDAETFRRDRWLRTSASHLATWSLAAFVLVFRFQMAPVADDPTGTAILFVIVAVSVLNSFTTERRVAKMVGPIGQPAFAGAGRMWAGILAVLVAASIGLLGASRSDAMFAIWMAGVGSGFVNWGREAKFPWYSGLGVAMLAVAALDLALASVSGPVGPLRIFVLGLALPVAGLLTNRRYLWFRPEG